MKPVQQTVFAAKTDGDEPGNCLAACVASILELPLEDVPNFVADGEWKGNLQGWLARYGLTAVYLPYKMGDILPAGPWVIATGKSPRGGTHAVVVQLRSWGLSDVHDPHPDGTFLDGWPTGITFFVALDPSVMTRLDVPSRPDEELLSDQEVRARVLNNPNLPDHCPFCNYSGPSPIIYDYEDAIVFEPLNPVTPGHVLVVPRRHVPNAASNSWITGRTMEAASLYAQTIGPCNIITSIGREATQTVDHLHVHVVPRRKDDGLSLPWDDGGVGEPPAPWYEEWVRTSPYVKRRLAEIKALIEEPPAPDKLLSDEAEHLLEKLKRAAFRAEHRRKVGEQAARIAAMDAKAAREEAERLAAALTKWHETTVDPSCEACKALRQHEEALR